MHNNPLRLSNSRRFTVSPRRMPTYPECRRTLLSDWVGLTNYPRVGSKHFESPYGWGYMSAWVGRTRGTGGHEWAPSSVACCLTVPFVNGQEGDHGDNESARIQRNRQRILNSPCFEVPLCPKSCHLKYRPGVNVQQPAKVPPRRS